MSTATPFRTAYTPLFSEDELHSWQCPNFEESAQKRMDWLENSIQEGERWWDSQTASKSEAHLDLLSARGPERLQTNNLKSDVRKFVETISDIREIATYGTQAEQMKETVAMFNDTVKYIYRAAHFPHQSRKALQYSVALARGYLWPRYRRSSFGWGPGQVEFVDLGPREVLPNQVPRDNDIQGSYAVTIIEAMGIAEAHARFPKFQEKLLPISRFRYTANSQVRRHEFWDRWRYGETQADWDRRYAEIRYTFVRDLRVNGSGKLFPMGEKNTSWYYEVPSLGAVMSWIDPTNGLPASRLAKREDARMYPLLRLLISNPGMEEPLYDGPAFDWHGEMPPVQYDVDDWPWLAVGYSLLHDIASVEKGERAFIDLMYRVLRAKMKPVMGYDLNSGVPREDMKRLDILDDSIQAIGVDGDPAKFFRSLVPDSVRVEADDFRMVELLERIRQKTLGLNDLASMASLKFNLSAENFDKILETIGPIAKGIAGNMEIGQAKIAQMLKFMIYQYFTTRKLMSIIGPEGVATKVFDFNPNSIVPSHMPWETDTESTSQAGQIERAKWAAQNMDVVSVPTALLNVTQMQEQMKWLNFLQRGLPVSFSTAFKKLGVENWGDTPGATEFEKWKNEQYEMIDIKAKAAALAQFEMGGPPNGQGKGQGKGGGRPPTGQQPPKLEKRGTQSGNLRTVVSQSK